MLSRCLLVYEMLAMFAPEEIKLDPFELMKTHGGLPFLIFLGCNGETSLHHRMFLKMFYTLVSYSHLKWNLIKS